MLGANSCCTSLIASVRNTYIADEGIVVIKSIVRDPQRPAATRCLIATHQAQAPSRK